MIYLTLLLAVAAETIGTSALNASQQFTRPWPSALALVSYGISFWLLAQTLRVLPMGVVYAVWAGLGILCISLIGLVVFGQRLDAAAIAGIALIVTGVGVIHLFSNTVGH